MEPSFKEPSAPEPIKRIYPRPQSKPGGTAGGELFRGLFKSPEPKNSPDSLRARPKPSRPTPREKTNAFGKEGITKREFKKVLARYNPHVDLERDEKVEIAEKIDKARYKDSVIKKYINELREEEHRPTGPDPKATAHTAHEEAKLLKDLLKPK